MDTLRGRGDASFSFPRTTELSSAMKVECVAFTWGKRVSHGKGPVTPRTLLPRWRAQAQRLAGGNVHTPGTGGSVTKEHLSEISVSSSCLEFFGFPQ